jgi:hypothetical protein
MRAELRRIREQLGIPFLHVTGSETEALAMGDRLIVLDQGRIGQLGTPTEVYDLPASANVARFLNCYNVFDGALDNGSFASAYGRLPFGTRVAAREPGYAVRYDRVIAKEKGTVSEAPLLPANYIASEYLGAALVHFFQTNDGKVVEVEHHLSNGPPDSFVEGGAYDLTWKSDDGIAFGWEAGVTSVEAADIAVDAPSLRRSHGIARTYLLIAPAVVWMTLFLVVPVAMIIYVSFWTQTTFKIEPTLTADSWQTFFSSDTYISSLWTTLRIWLVVLFATFILGYPTALFVGLFVKNKTLQTVLLVLCVIPF